nr:hypothetical protein [Pectobacterium parmentieri]
MGLRCIHSFTPPRDVRQAYPHQLVLDYQPERPLAEKVWLYRRDAHDGDGGAGQDYY